jgi:hypothetical protein
LIYQNKIRGVILPSSNNRGTKERKITDADRFNMAVSKIIGKRLTFAELTGKTAVATCF